MGIETMRRWPMYCLVGACILLVLSLLNSWSLQMELQNKAGQISTQLQECSKQQTSCMEESMTLLEQRESCLTKMNLLEKEKLKLTEDLEEIKKEEAKSKRSLVDLELCQTELQLLKNLQVSKKAVIDTLRYEKDTLMAQLSDTRKKIEELKTENEVLRSTSTTKSSVNAQLPLKVTPAAQPPKLSPPINVHNPINDLALENDAKEEIEDVNIINDGNDFDPQLT